MIPNYLKLEELLASLRGPVEPHPLTGSTMGPAPMTGSMDEYAARVQDTEARARQVPRDMGLVPDLAPSDPRAQNDLGAAPMVPPGSPYAQGAYSPAKPGDTGTIPKQKPGKPQRLSPLDAARQEEEKALVAAGKAKFDTEVAGQDAARALIDRQAEVMDAANNERTTADADFQAKREKARADAMVDTGRWLQKLEAMSRQEPNPQRYWQNTDGFGKALWLLGMAFSSASQIGEKGAGMRVNPVIEMLQAEISQDIQLQKERQEREIAVERTRGDIMQRGHAEKMTDMRDDYSMMYARLDSLEKAMQLRASAPGDEDMAFSSAKAVEWTQEAKFRLSHSKAEEAARAQESALQRSHAAGMQAREHQLRKDLATIEASAAVDVAKEKARGEVGTRFGFKRNEWAEIPLATGVVVTDDKGQPIKDEKGRPVPFAVTKQNEQKAREFVDTASNTIRDVKRVRDKLRTIDWDDFLVKGDPELESLIVKLGYQTAKAHDPGGRITQPDFEYGITSRLGTSFTTMDRAAQLAQIRSGREGLADHLEKELQRMPEEFNHKLTSMYESGLYGGEQFKVKWSPVNLDPPTPGEPSHEGQLKAAGVDPGKMPAIVTSEDYQDAKELGELPPYVGLNATEVTRSTQIATKATPDKLKGLVEAARSKFKDDPRAFYEVQEAVRANEEEAQEAYEDTVNRVWTKRKEIIEHVRDKHKREITHAEAQKWLDVSKTIQRGQGK